MSLISKFQQAKALTLRLHILGTQVESEETDNIRDEIDVLWNQLTAEERTELAKYSAELYKDDKRTKNLLTNHNIN